MIESRLNCFHGSHQLDFGIAGSSLLVCTLNNQPWVTAQSAIVPFFKDSARNVEAMLEELQVTWSNLVPGIGFDITVHAPNGRFYGLLTIGFLGC